MVRNAPDGCRRRGTDLDRPQATLRGRPDPASRDCAVEDLAASGQETVRLAQVVDATTGRHHLLFLAPDTDDVVGSLWVRQRD